MSCETWPNKISNHPTVDPPSDRLDKSLRVTDEPEVIQVACLVARGRAEAGDDGGGGDAGVVAGDGPVDGAFVLDLLAACPVPGAEPAAAAVEGALELTPEKPVEEDLGSSLDLAVCDPDWGRACAGGCFPRL